MNEKILKNFNGDELAATVFENKYAMKNKNGELEEFSLDDIYNRMFNEMKKIDNSNFTLLKNNFLPGGRILYALGNKYDTTATFSNCYVTSIEEDSIEGIFDTAKRQARIFSKGGGVGFDITSLRPKGSLVNNSAKSTSGAVSFMDLFSMVTGLIGQHGRRGALMLTMNVNHPEIIDFINVKGGKDKTKVQYANISIKITNKFMDAVENDENWEMIYTLKDGNKFKKVEEAKIIWDLIVESNYNGAEPGLLFWDNILDNDPSNIFYETRAISTNPCGEQPLESGGACNLGSINLSNFVLNPFTDDAKIDWEKLSLVTKLSVRFLDNVNILNLNRQPLKENKIALKLGNRIGLGITGLADMLIKMNLKYDSDDGIELAKKISYCLKDDSINASIDLAEERGACGIIKKHKYDETNEYLTWSSNNYWESLDETQYEKLMKYGIRNIGLNTIAPNGSLGIILQGASGIEPIFALSYKRRVKEAGKEKDFTVYHPLVKEYDSIFGKDAHLNNENFIIASQIDWKKRVRMQSVLQRSVSQSISSTVNLPSDTSKEIISNIYKEAWKQGLKGITIYRDGSRDGILTEKKKVKHNILETVKFPEQQEAIMKVIKSEGKKWYCTYTIDRETKLPNSLFVNTNSTETNILTEDVLEHLETLSEKYIKNGHLEKLKRKHNNQTNVTKIARTLSLLLRHRVSIVDIIKTIEKIKPPIFSFVFQIKKLLSSFVEGEYTGEKCSECGNQLIFEAGCSICMNCGTSKCG